VKDGMQDNKRHEPISMGFITVQNHPNLGFLGGYLIVNELARPLEFHCTLPIQPTRAQQILYGKTLNDFLCGEQIARAMVTKAKTKPDVLFTDTAAVLTLRHTHSVPLALVEQPRQVREPSYLSMPEKDPSDLHHFSALGLKLTLLPTYTTDTSSFASLFGGRTPNLDFLEPFGRIEEALREAHPVTKAA
jgi:hypothetical protein